MTTTAISSAQEMSSLSFSNKPRVLPRGVSVSKQTNHDMARENVINTKTVTSNAYLLQKNLISTKNTARFSKALRNNTAKSFIISKKSDVKFRTDGLTNQSNKLNPIKPNLTQAISTEPREPTNPIKNVERKKLPLRGGLSLERNNLRQKVVANGGDTGAKPSSSSRRESNATKLAQITQSSNINGLIKQTEIKRPASKNQSDESPNSDDSSFQPALNATRSNIGSSGNQMFRIKSKTGDLIKVNQLNSHSESSDKDAVNSSSNKVSTPGSLTTLEKQPSLKGGASEKSDDSETGNTPTLGSSSNPNPKPESLTKLSLTKSSAPRGLVGLRNIGNTCFMNSILQCLFNTPLFFDYFLQGTHRKEKNPKNKGLADAFAELLGKVKSHAGSISHSAENTSDVKSRISRINSMFSGYNQHDAQEFLKAILEGINDDVNRVVTKPAYKELTADPQRKIQDISDEWYNYMLARDNSIITDLFCGQLMSKITCTHCNNESLAFDNFWDLALSFTKTSSSKTHLSDMLAQFLKEEALEDLFHCEKCKVRRKSKKRFVIWKLPKVLVVQLKRFEYTQHRRDKINKTVTFPVSNFDLSKFTQESTDDSARDCKYTLFGMVNHGGSLSGGHYTAECMNSDNRKWYNFNDSSVRETSMSKEESESSSPYILFYVKSSCLGTMN